MRFIERMKELVVERLENHGGLIFVSGKKLLVEAGCAQLEEVINAVRAMWQAFCKNTDIPWVPEAMEQRLETAVWARIEKGIRDFAAKFCVASDGFASADQESLAALIEDATLPVV